MIDLQSRSYRPHGFLHLSVTEDPDAWTWSTVHVTVDPELNNNVAQGTADTRDHARQLADRAAELRLHELRDQGIHGVPARG